MSGRDLTPEPDDVDQAPSRWSEGAGSDDPTQRRIAALWRKLPPPADLPAARLNAVRARLPGPASGPSRARGLRPWAWALAALLLLLGSGVVAAARGWVSWVHLRPAATAPAAARPPLASSKPRARTARAVTPEALPMPAPAPDLAAPEPAPRSPAPPAVASPRPRRPPAPVAVATPVPGDPPAPPPQTEASVLEAAVATLRRQGDARAALRMLDGYDDRFAHGLLAPEADRLRIDAWLVLGDRGRALQRLNQVALSDGARDLELLLIRGELRVALAGCAGAREDFARVLARVADPALAARARAGVAACARAGAGGAR